MLSYILERIIFILAYLLLEVIVLLTGDALVYLFTFGKAKPEWVTLGWGNEKREKKLTSTPAFWIGLGFWLLLALILILAMI